MTQWTSTLLGLGLKTKCHPRLVSSNHFAIEGLRSIEKEVTQKETSTKIDVFAF